LCDPFTKDIKTISKVNSKYTITNDIIDWKEETSIVLTTKEKNEYINELKDLKNEEFSFITKIFFLTYKTLQIGIFKTEERLRNISIKYEETLKKLDIIKNMGTNSPDYELLMNQADDLIKAKWAMETQLFENSLIFSLTRFFNW
jgi:hypothetical protein